MLPMTRLARGMCLCLCTVSINVNCLLGLLGMSINIITSLWMSQLLTICGNDIVYCVIKNNDESYISTVTVEYFACSMFRKYSLGSNFNEKHWICTHRNWPAISILTAVPLETEITLNLIAWFSKTYCMYMDTCTSMNNTFKPH